MAARRVRASVVSAEGAPPRTPASLRRLLRTSGNSLASVPKSRSNSRLRWASSSGVCAGVKSGSRIRAYSSTSLKGFSSLSLTRVPRNAFSSLGDHSNCCTYLPTVEGSCSTGANSAADSVSGGAETILVAEDDPLVRALAVRTLEEAGYATVRRGWTGGRVLVRATPPAYRPGAARRRDAPAQWSPCVPADDRRSAGAPGDFLHRPRPHHRSGPSVRRRATTVPAKAVFFRGPAASRTGTSRCAPTTHDEIERIARMTPDGLSVARHPRVTRRFAGEGWRSRTRTP